MVLLHALRQLLLPVKAGQVGIVGQLPHDFSHVITEAFNHFGLVRRGVPQHVVHAGGHERVRVAHSRTDEQFNDLGNVFQVRAARTVPPPLAVMFFRGVHERGHYARHDTAVICT